MRRCLAEERRSGAMTNGRQKGKRGELELCEFLREYGYTARRGQQFAGHPDAPDVVTSLDARVFFDAKRVEALQIHPALAQVTRDEGGRGRVPVVMFKRNRSDWIAVLSGREFMRLVTALFPPPPKQETNDVNAPSP